MTLASITLIRLLAKCAVAVAADGSGQTRLTDNPGIDTDPAWLRVQR